MSNPNTATAHNLTKTLLRGYEHYANISRAEYDEVYTACYQALLQILNWGANPLKLQPILVNMRQVEGNLFKRREAISRLWCEFANHIKYEGCDNWQQWKTGQETL